MHNHGFGKWLLRAWCVMMAVYVLLTAASAVRMADVDRLAYAGADGYVYEVDFVNRQVYARNIDGTWNGVELSGTEAAWLKASGALALLPLWRTDYVGPLGDQADIWFLETAYSNGTKRVAGAGDWPVTWRLVVPKVQRLGRRALSEAVKPESSLPPGISGMEI